MSPFREIQFPCSFRLKRHRLILIPIRLPLLTTIQVLVQTQAPAHVLGLVVQSLPGFRSIPRTVKCPGPTIFLNTRPIIRCPGPTIFLNMLRNIH
jgi:hypothetical protein